MDAETLDPVADPRWLRLVEDEPSASIFHHPAWLALLRDHYRYPMLAPCVVDAGRVVAGVPLADVRSRLTGRRLVAVPFSDECPPLVVDEEARPALVAALADLHAAGHAVELRSRVPGIPGAQEEQRHVTHDVELHDDVARLERDAVRPSLLRGARKAERLGVQVERRTSPGALDEFYALHLRTRRRQGVPTQPKGFIDGLAALFAAGLGFVLVARHDGRPVAAAVFLQLHGTLTYKYGASDERHLDLRPNNLVFREAIRWGCAQGLRRLDLGRTDLDNTGLRGFKSGWGGRERPVTYTYLGDAGRGRGGGRAGALVGAVIRNTPPATGRLLGAALYRHLG